MKKNMKAAETSTRLLDREFARWLVLHFGSALNKKQQQQLQCLAEAVSHATHLKHTCLDMQKYKALNDGAMDELLQGISAETVKQLVTADIKPLVCSADGRYVWLQKYHAFEQGVARHLRARLDGNGPHTVSASQEQLLSQLFDAQSGEQRDAAVKALTHRLAIITGGPGTGKTWTVARLLVLLLEQNPDCVIKLAAPTGKAGARMKEALDKSFADANGTMQHYSHFLEKLPKKASTLDSLLGISHGSPLPRRNKQSPIACDVLIVDEASMIALPMMYRLLEALPESARLVLLGDKDQLASVEAGNVLGDLCAEPSPLASCLARITVSRRFQGSPEIGTLAQNINAARAQLATTQEQVKLHITSTQHSVQDSAQELAPAWLAQATQEYSALLQEVETAVDDASVKHVLQQQSRFQLLCALREGSSGVRGINRLVAEALHKPVDGWYAGRPVMVTQNDHSRKLYNGDVGLVLPRRTAEGAVVLKACFLFGDTLREISQAQMPPHETCYAMTVHKSQGSEYEHVSIVLPSSTLTPGPAGAPLGERSRTTAPSQLLNPVITRELVYTAVTRARQRIDIWCGEGVLDTAVQRQLVRMSGLRALL